MTRSFRQGAFCAAVILLAAAPLRAQEAYCTGGAASWREMPSPLVAHDHWAVRALERADALGLIPEYFPAQRSISRDDVARALGSAAARAVRERPDVAPLIRSWCERFAEEFPEVRPLSDDGRSERRIEAAAAIGLLTHSGAVEIGSGLFQNMGDQRYGAIPRPDEAKPRLEAGAFHAPSDRLGLFVEAAFDGSRGSLPSWALVAPLGPFEVIVGRQPAAYGSAESGAVTFSGVAPITGVQIFTRKPFRLPGWFRHLGPWSAHTFLSRFRERRHPGDPWFWGANLTWRPHRRLTLAGNRESIFGGDSVGVPTTPRTIIEMLIGVTDRPTNGFDNQNASVEIRYRPPTEAVLPLVLYVEAAMEDIDVVRGLRDSPGFIAGIFVPALPWVPNVHLGVERTNLADSCLVCNNGAWYRHGDLRGGWAVDEGPLGHPLGGHGTETFVFAGGDFLEARLRLRAHAFRRDRGWENLYAPEREGRSHGFMLEALWRIRPRAEVLISEYRESGRSWTEQRFEARLAIRY